MTGSWLIVKWVGLAALALYLVLLLFLFWGFRGRLAELSRFVLADSGGEFCRDGLALVVRGRGL